MADRLLVYGTGTAEGFDKLVDDKNVGFKITKLAAGTGPSDHDSFYRKKVPVIFFFTGTHAEYHRPVDTPDKINIPGMKKVVDYGFNLVDYAATTTAKPVYTVTKERFVDPTEQRPSSPRMSGPTLGIMPSYEEGETGVKVDGISPGGAAEKAGLKDGDIIVEINGKPVTNVTTYMSVMNQQKAGVEIEVVLKRKGEKKTLKITPTARK
jgi:predicted metalloprotease with PDZ domain